MSNHKIKSHFQNPEHDYHASIEFAYKMAYRWYQCHPSDVPQHIFITKENNQVVSTVGVTEGNATVILPIRNLYEIDSAYLPNDWNWNHVAQLSWFFNERKGWFSPLLLTALQFCYNSKKKYAILQMKEKVFTILSKKGVRLIQIDNEKLLHDRIGEKDIGYYLESTPIRLYYLNIFDNINSIQSYISDIR